MSLLHSNLRHYKKHYSIVVLACFVTALAMIISYACCVDIVTSLTRARDRLGADVAVVSAGCDEDILHSIFDGDIVSLTLDKGWVDKLSDLSQVDTVASQVFLGTLDGADCCDGSVQLIAFDPINDFQISPYLSTDCKNLQDDEIVVGANFITDIGDTIKYYNREFKVAGILEKTGLSYDSAAYISYEGLSCLLSDERNAETLPDLTGKTSVVFVRAQADITSTVLSEVIRSRFGYSEISVVKVSSRIDTAVESFKVLQRFIYAGYMVLVFLDLLIVISIINLLIMSRKAEIGTLRLFGKSQIEVLKMYIGEVCYVVLGTRVFAGAVSVVVLLAFSNSFVSVPIREALVMWGLMTVESLLASAGSVCVTIRNISKNRDIIDLIKEET